MKTLLVADLSGSDLGRAATLAEARQVFAGDAVRLAACGASPAGPRLVDGPAGVAAFAPEQVVLCGEFGALDPAFPYLRAALEAGARLRVHNLGVAGRGRRRLAVEGRELLRRAESFSVRDFRSLEETALWGMRFLPRMAGYPERELAADFHLADLLPRGPCVGLAVASGPGLAALLNDAPRLRTLIEGGGPAAVVPLLVSVAGDGAGEDDDVAAFHRLAEAVLPGATVALSETLDRGWWRSNLTPQRLKGLVVRCRQVFSAIDLPLVFAAAGATPVTCLYGQGDDQAARALATLANFTFAPTALERFPHMPRTEARP